MVLNGESIYKWMIGGEPPFLETIMYTYWEFSSQSYYDYIAGKFPIICFFFAWNLLTAIPGATSLQWPPPKAADVFPKNAGWCTHFDLYIKLTNPYPEDRFWMLSITSHHFGGLEVSNMFPVSMLFVVGLLARSCMFAGIIPRFKPIYIINPTRISLMNTCFFNAPQNHGVLEDLHLRPCKKRGYSMQKFQGNGAF